MTASPGAAPDPTPTWSVTELHEAIDGLLEHVFGGEVWVEGELRNLSRSARGHVYFDLVDPDAPNDATRPTLAVTLFDRERQAVNRFLMDGGLTRGTSRDGAPGRPPAVRMVDGVRVRIRGRLTTYAPRSTLQLRMSWIDPTFTLGLLGQERERVLAALHADGLLGVNAALALPLPPLRVALVTSIGSAAHADVIDELRRSGFGFRLTVLDARTQGMDAERSLLRALRLAAALPVDVVALVRGGGARTDLAAFDSERVARAIAALGRPVLTGIGHEIDRTVADDVAHTSHKTPTACAAALATAARLASEEVHDTWVRLGSAAQGRLVRAERRLTEQGRDAGRAALRHVDRDRHHVVHLERRMVTIAPLVPARAAAKLDSSASRLAPAARRAVTRSASVLDSLAARARVHDPALALARGWSITRDGRGRLVRSVSQLSPGDGLVTRVADGEVASEVAETTTDTTRSEK